MPQLASLSLEAPKILIYGRPGTGKTSFTMTLGESLEIIESDPQGYGVGLTLKDGKEAIRAKVEVSYFRDDPVVPGTGWGKLKARVLSIANDLRANKYTKKVVAFDSLTSAGELALRYVRANSGKPLSGPPSQPEWGAAMLELEFVINLALGFRIPAIFLAHEDTEQTDPNGQFVQKKPYIIGQRLLPKVIANLTEVYYAKLEPKGGGSFLRLLQTSGTPGIEAKSGRSIPNFDMSRGAQALFEELKFPL